MDLNKRNTIVMTLLNAIYPDKLPDYPPDFLYEKTNQVLKESILETKERLECGKIETDQDKKRENALIALMVLYCFPAIWEKAIHPGKFCTQKGPRGLRGISR